jgi:alanine dehydrogenase
VAGSAFAGELKQAQTSSEGDSMASIRILTAADVKAALSIADAIEATRMAFAQLSSGRAEAPLRTQWSASNGTALVMPAYLPDSRGLGAKIVSVFPGNPGRGLPTVNALVALLDTETGQPIALLDGTYLTALRTGAASGVATSLLALPDADTAAIFGAGVQARTQLLALCTVRSIRCAWVYDRDTERAKVFVAEMAGQAPVPADLRLAASPAEALREARIVATATTSNSPVFADADLMPGAHICAIGAFTPQMQEVPVETVRRARIFVDQRAAALAEAGDLSIPIEQGLLAPEGVHEIGEVINGQIVGRESSDQVTLFKSVGNAVQDIAAATRALRIAEERGLGTIVEL